MEDVDEETRPVLGRPANPVRVEGGRCSSASILPVFDGGDHLHPNDRGMQAMADAVDLTALDCATYDSASDAS
ncbi:hypothetical protein AQJ91_43400 [Streptomyces dysideae]|uniref:SGNH hydrolase-type esterase domain-containing protein n=1 Tax=Streptomyces dysideae TaxID=909626 RepID=A0A101UQJ5_9ACTN|nr:hypothetical protein AQJ91_43400 [Streptomyces dysideae]